MLELIFPKAHTYAEEMKRFSPLTALKKVG